MPDYEQERNEFVNYLRSQLIGPAEEEDEKLKDRPDQRYLMGMLYPQEADATEVFDDEDNAVDVAESGSDDCGGCDAAVSLAYQRLPSSAGISFYIDGDAELDVEIRAAAYTRQKCEITGGKKENKEQKNEDDVEKVKHEHRWCRQALGTPDDPESHRVGPPADDRSDVRVKVLGDRAELSTVWRAMDDGYLVTATLVNTGTGKVTGREAAQKSLFQVGLRCRPVGGAIRSYPAPVSAMSGEEQEELTLQYRNVHTYAVGHGCAADWHRSTAGPPDWVAVEFMPAVDVKPVDFLLPGAGDDAEEVLNVRYLSDESITKQEIAARLRQFVDSYRDWFEKLCDAAVPGHLADARSRILARIDGAIVRMEAGIGLLEKDDLVLRSFRLANRAMLIQMIHVGAAVAGTERELDDCRTPDINYESPEHGKTWRPFQLAFQLLLLESMVDPESKDRQLVDLIWFPTGGGKTEAYLAVAAFEMIYRRLKRGDRGGGTAVIKRYTLRLLTSQQFQRAAGLICALEFMRRRAAEGLGGEVFSIGLWVGEGSTPNRFTLDGENQRGALQLFKEMLEDDKPDNKFQLKACPWCGTRIVPGEKNDDRSHYGVTATETSFTFNCVNPSCEFHENLPVQVVDDALFRDPPTLLIGTIDKFARLAWDHRGRAFFGFGNGDVDPPSLIIQDEMHLISGPLGTIAGLYEAAMDVAIKSAGCRPKIIAATATIRRAAEQSQRLYARDVRIFPPPGIHADDSYFSRVDHAASGRLYIGVMGQGHTPVTSQVQTSAALCQAAKELDLSEAARDAWWTQVIYHNSKRELGKTMTLARDDIDARVKVIVRDEARLRSVREVEELSGNIPGHQIPEILSRLKLQQSATGALDIVPCTNMISVGVDVSRLGLMLIAGQPKTTSEYIQASSRVGRDPRRPPGVVVTLYSGTKPRDRSHYEGFVSYHQALYRSVEPTSVTPYAPPARDRALHAAVIILMRLAGGLPQEVDSGSFDHEEAKTKLLLDALVERMQQADPEEAAAIRADLDVFVSEWREKVDRHKKTLRYTNNSAGRQYTPLLSTFEEQRPEGRRTLNSMRHVDVECVLRVIGEKQQ